LVTFFRRRSSLGLSALREGVRSDADDAARDVDHRAIVARIALVSAINMVAPARVGKRGADDDDLQDCL
jgi:hypothetical protein